MTHDIGEAQLMDDLKKEIDSLDLANHTKAAVIGFVKLAYVRGYLEGGLARQESITSNYKLADCVSDKRIE